jgi:hypothetical protein
MSCSTDVFEKTLQADQVIWTPAHSENNCTAIKKVESGNISIETALNPSG